MLDPRAQPNLFERLGAGVERLRRWLGREPPRVWYDARFRLPVHSLEAHLDLEPRRADYVAAVLVDKGLVKPEALRHPVRIGYAQLARVHSDAYLESLTQAKTLAQLFAAEPSEIRVDEVMATVRLGAGATLAAARESVASRGHTLNLLGGFHHAGPDRGGPLCPVNDIAVAVAVVRSEGFEGRVGILDLDAHPPDGTAACFVGDEEVWIGSLSGSDWCALPGVDETVLPPGCDDDTYLRALDELCERMPRIDLAFVIAGGDVLAGDALGTLGLTLDGARRRDQRVRERLTGVPAVWLPGGGYSERAWRCLAGTALVLAGLGDERIDPGYDPLHAAFARIAASLPGEALGFESEITLEDVLLDLGAATQPRRLLGFYSAEGIEHAWSRYGLFDHLERLGFYDFRVAIDLTEGRDRLRLYGRHAPEAGELAGKPKEHMLIECVLERAVVDERPVLLVHWLTMQNPTIPFGDDVRPLPGQRHPGLGLGREAAEILRLMAQRLGLVGVAFQPSWYHMAHVAPGACQFVDPARQGRFEALKRDLADVPLADATRAVADGRVFFEGEPYEWEPGDMVMWLEDHASDPGVVEGERERAHFTLRPVSS